MPLFIVPRFRSQMFLAFVAPEITSRCRRKHFQTVCIVKTSLDSGANSNVKCYLRHLRKNTVRMSSRNTAVLCVLSSGCNVAAKPRHNTKKGTNKMRSGRNTFFRCFFRSWKFSEPAFITAYLEAVQKILLYVGDSCIDEDILVEDTRASLAGGWTPPATLAQGKEECN